MSSSLLPPLLTAQQLHLRLLHPAGRPRSGYRQGVKGRTTLYPLVPWDTAGGRCCSSPCILATPLTSCCRGCRRCSIGTSHPISPATAEGCRLRIMAGSCVELEQCYCVCRKESLCAGRNMVCWHSRITHPPPGAQSRRAACVRREAGGRQRLATPCVPFLRRLSRGGMAAPARHRACLSGAGSGRRRRGQEVAGSMPAASPPRPALGACECIADFGYAPAIVETPLGIAGRQIRSSRILRTKCGLVERRCRRFLRQLYR